MKLQNDEKINENKMEKKLSLIIKWSATKNNTKEEKNQIKFCEWQPRGKQHKHALGIKDFFVHYQYLFRA